MITLLVIKAMYRAFSLKSKSLTVKCAIIVVAMASIPSCKTDNLALLIVFTFEPINSKACC